MPHWLVIDLEATTEEGGWPVAEMEVIEIGATLVNQDGRELDHFERFVRPVRRPVLTHFCRDLTISVKTISTAPRHSLLCGRCLSDSLSHHKARRGMGELGRLRPQAVGGTMASARHDQRLVRHAVRQSQTTLRQARQLQRPVGLNSALQLASMQFTGQQHRALVDARNTAGNCCR